MTLVVADTSPLNYLVLIEAAEVLPRLYDRVIIPNAVLRELTHIKAPAVVKDWAASLPAWAEVRTASNVTLTGILDPGEAEAIALAQELKAEAVLLDELEGREEALRLGLPVAGTVGVLEKAAEHGWIDLEGAFSRLAQCRFHVSAALMEQALERDAARRRQREREL